MVFQALGTSWLLYQLLLSWFYCGCQKISAKDMGIGIHPFAKGIANEVILSHLRTLKFIYRWAPPEIHPAKLTVCDHGVSLSHYKRWSVSVPYSLLLNYLDPRVESCYLQYDPMMEGSLNHTMMQNNSIIQSSPLGWSDTCNFLSHHLESFIMNFSHTHTLLVIFQILLTLMGLINGLS